MAELEVEFRFSAQHDFPALGRIGDCSGTGASRSYRAKLAYGVFQFNEDKNVFMRLGSLENILQVGHCYAVSLLGIALRINTCAGGEEVGLAEGDAEL